MSLVKHLISLVGPELLQALRSFLINIEFDLTDPTIVLLIFAVIILKEALVIESFERVENPGKVFVLVILHQL